MQTAGKWVIGFAVIAAGGLANAQSWPARPVRIVVPWAPGGATDIIARPLAQKLTERLGQQFIVDNRGGANSLIGTDIAAKAP
ncbi:MAG TPA: tripartite tricarboxylate transporter substrate-binding protein, partial [Burkholderiales bacterium]|nr:tripartite tricarboxylate transporter substrate-binding protein [Burkholderiales bacterium]